MAPGGVAGDVDAVGIDGVGFFEGFGEGGEEGDILCGGFDASPLLKAFQACTSPRASGRTRMKFSAVAFSSKW